MKTLDARECTNSNRFRPNYLRNHRHHRKPIHEEYNVYFCTRNPCSFRQRNNRSFRQNRRCNRYDRRRVMISQGTRYRDTSTHFRDNRPIFRSSTRPKSLRNRPLRRRGIQTRCSFCFCSENIRVPCKNVNLKRSKT